MPKTASPMLILTVGGARFALIATGPGHYVKTHPSALFVACTYCNAERGEQCRGADGRTGTVSAHVWRREAAQKALKAGMTLDVDIGHGFRVDLTKVDPTKGTSDELPELRNAPQRTEEQHLQVPEVRPDMGAAQQGVARSCASCGTLNAWGEARCVNCGGSMEEPEFPSTPQSDARELALSVCRELKREWLAQRKQMGDEADNMAVACAIIESRLGERM